MRIDEMMIRLEKLLALELEHAMPGDSFFRNLHVIDCRAPTKPRTSNHSYCSKFAARMCYSLYMTMCTMHCLHIVPHSGMTRVDRGVCHGWSPCLLRP